MGKIKKLKLKPCPFCGAKPTFWEWNGGARVDCSKWGSRKSHDHFVGIGAQTLEEAAKLWNTRYDSNHWILCKDKLPDTYDAVIVAWTNHNPAPYYADVKDKPFVGTAHYFNGKWYWYSSVCLDYLKEYGTYPLGQVDEDVEIVAWTPMPMPYCGE